MSYRLAECLYGIWGTHRDGDDVVCQLACRLEGVQVTRVDDRRSGCAVDRAIGTHSYGTAPQIRDLFDENCGSHDAMFSPATRLQ